MLYSRSAECLKTRTKLTTFFSFHFTNPVNYDIATIDWHSSLINGNFYLGEK